MGFRDLEGLRSLMSLPMMAILIRLGSEVHYPQARSVDDSQLPDLEGQALDFVGKDWIRTCHECHPVCQSFVVERASRVSFFSLDFLLSKVTFGVRFHLPSFSSNNFDPWCSIIIKNVNDGLITFRRGVILNTLIVINRIIRDSWN